MPPAARAMFSKQKGRNRRPVAVMLGLFATPIHPALVAAQATGRMACVHGSRTPPPLPLEQQGPHRGHVNLRKCFWLPSSASTTRFWIISCRANLILRLFGCCYVRVQPLKPSVTGGHDRATVRCPERALGVSTHEAVATTRSSVLVAAAYRPPGCARADECGIKTEMGPRCS